MSEQAAKNEAEAASTTSIEYGGNSYTVPASFEEADGGLLEALRTGGDVVVQALLGQEQFETFRKSKPKVKDYRAFQKLWMEAIGMENSGE